MERGREEGDGRTRTDGGVCRKEAYYFFLFCPRSSRDLEFIQQKRMLFFPLSLSKTRTLNTSPSWYHVSARYVLGGEALNLDQEMM